MEDNLMEKVKGAVKYWWISLLVGILAIIVGIWCLFTPDATLVALTYLFITVFLAGGIFEVIFAVSNRKVLRGWGWSLAGGILEIALALIIMTLPLPMITLMLIYMVGFWIMFRSFWAIGEAVELQHLHVPGWGWFLAMAILCVLLSFIFLISPAFSGAFLVSLVGIALMVYGIFRIYLSTKLHSAHKYIKDM